MYKVSELIGLLQYLVYGLNKNDINGLNLIYVAGRNQGYWEFATKL